MPKSTPVEDDALRYLLEQMSPAERRGFEARLEQSAPLRALLRGLEEGVVALALTAPQREPPAWMEQRLQQTLALEAARKASAGSLKPLWLWSGWAAAACLLGLLLLSHFRSPQPAPVSQARPVLSGTQNQVALEELPLKPAVALPLKPIAPSAAPSRPSTAEPSPGSEPNLALRRRLSELQTQLAQLSQSLTQQQALWATSSRFFPLQLTPAGAAAAPNPGLGPPPSPEVQRALLLALARQLGWLRPPAASGSGDPAAPSSGADAGVDFVDLPSPELNATPDNTISLTNLQAQAAPASTADSSTSAGSEAISGFVMGSNVVLVLSQSMLPPTSGPVTIWAGTAAGGLQPSSPISVGSLPTVVSFSTPASADGPVFVVSSGVFGNLTVLGQFFGASTTTH